MGRPRIPKIMIKEFIRLYRTGLSCVEVAKQCGVTQNTVWRHLDKRGLLREQKMVKMSDVKEWIRLYIEENETCSSIGRKYGFDHETVRRHLIKNGIDIEKKGSRHSLVYDQMICLYDKDDFLRYCFENIYQMIEELDIPYMKAHLAIWHIRHGKTKSMNLNGKRYKVVLIDNEEEV